MEFHDKFADKFDDLSKKKNRAVSNANAPQLHNYLELSKENGFGYKILSH